MTSQSREGSDSLFFLHLGLLSVDSVVKVCLYWRKQMKWITGIGMLLILAGCGLSVSGGQNAEPVAEGWYGPGKTSEQRSQDMDQCHINCYKT